MTVFDPQYSTKVSFNTPIMIKMLKERDIGKLIHWFENGEPNKKLAAAALEELLLLNWVEALELLWELGWITKKSIITKSWTAICGGYGHFYRQVLLGSNSEKWLIEKTYNEKVLSKNELNNLHLNNLKLITHNRNNDYWNMFFTKELVLKGATSDSIFFSLNYFSNHDIYNSNSKKDVEFENLSRTRLQQFIAHKNGFEIEYTKILNILIQQDDLDLFWKIIESKMVMNKKDLFILATMVSMYFNTVGSRVKKLPQSEIDNNLERALKAFIKAGLPASVIFTKDDFIDKYSHVFELGYIAFRNLNMQKYSFSDGTVAYQLDYVNAGFYHKDKAADFEFFTGDAFFAKPYAEKGYNKDIKYHPLNEKEKISFRDKFNFYFK